MRDNPCGVDCPRRGEGCHAKCNDYAAFWERCEERRKARAEAASIREMREGLRKNLVRKMAYVRQGRAR